MPFEKVGVTAVVEGVDQYVRSGQRVERANQQMGRSGQDLSRGMRAGATDALKLGAAIAGASLTIHGAIFLAKRFGEETIGASVAFESSFAGIIKTVDLTEDGYQRLREANRQLAKEIPVGVDEINKIGELGGQLGIRGIDNLTKFEKTVAEVGVTTNLTTEDAALAFAQIANVIKLPQDQIENLASSVVGLGNNFATTESRIVDFVQRIAGAGQIAGLSAGDITGIAAAFSSLGIEAEAGGTAVQKVLINMNTAATEGGDNLEIFARVSGLTATQFKDLWQKDAGEAFRLFVQGLGLAGDDAITVLSALGLEDQRLLRSFLSAAGASDVLTRAMIMGNQEFTSNNALQNEAAKRFETTASRAQKLANQVHDIGITAGDAALKGFDPLIRSVEEWMKTNGDQFGRDLARAISDAFQAGTELAGILKDIANVFPISGLIDIGVKATGSERDFAVLAAAIAAGFLIGGPLGAVIAGALMAGAQAVYKLTGDPGTPDQQAIAKAAGLSTAEIAAAQQRLGTARITNDFAKWLGEEADRRHASVAALSDMISRGEIATPFGIDPANTNFPQMPGKIPGLPTLKVTNPSTGGSRNAPDLTGIGPEDPAAKKAADAEKRRIEQQVQDIEDARQKLHDQDVKDVNHLGELITTALQRRAKLELDQQTKVIDARRKSESAIHDQRLKDIKAEGDAERKQIEDSRDAQIRAIEATRDATLASLQGQLDALDSTEAQQTRADLERAIALAYDPQARADAERALADFDRQQQRQAIQSQMDTVRAQADAEIEIARTTAEAKLEAVQAQIDAQTEAEQKHYEDLQALFDAAEEGARNAYEQMTDDYRLQAEARRLIEEQQQQAIIGLLQTYVPEWNTKGIALGQALIDGIRRAGIETYIDSLLGRVPGGNGSSSVATARAQEIAGINANGERAKAAGAPQAALDDLRRQVIALGGAPTFARGILEGAVPDRYGAVPVWAHPGELIFNRSQQSDLMDLLAGGGRTVYQEGAFRGMFDGATFEGNPETIARELVRLIDYQTGRGAHLAGV